MTLGYTKRIDRTNGKPKENSLNKIRHNVYKIKEFVYWYVGVFPSTLYPLLTIYLRLINYNIEDLLSLVQE